MFKFVIGCNFILLALTLLLVTTHKNLQQIHYNAVRTSADKVLNIQNYSRFNAYLDTFNKSYTGHEYFTRLHNFRESLKEIEALNALENGDVVFGHTMYSDMSKAEFAKIVALRPSEECQDRYGECGPYKAKTNQSCSSNDDKQFDWRKEGYVTSVLDQKMCSGCWAFSIVGVMETMKAKEDGLSHDRLSVQQLIDCAPTSHCNGGNIGDALHYLCYEDIGITTEEQYPLTLIYEGCALPGNKQGRKISFYRIECGMDENQMVDLVRCHGPLVAIINGAPLQYYISGIIRRACYRSKDGDSFDHAIQIVGYDKTGSIPYYIVRNSMGVNFGIEGYVKIAIGWNVCGIHDEVAYLDVL